MPVTIIAGPATVLPLDSDQMEQLLINLVRNAVDAVLSEAINGETLVAAARIPRVTLAWRRMDEEIEITISDTGPGLANPANLFVPFFTTKPKGSGIGLILCRQIAESHGGSVTLENRVEPTGCVARLRLPLT